jgi:hypothetical protein
MISIYNRHIHNKENESMRRIHFDEGGNPSAHISCICNIVDLFQMIPDYSFTDNITLLFAFTLFFTSSFLPYSSPFLLILSFSAFLFTFLIPSSFTSSLLSFLLVLLPPYSPFSILYFLLFASLPNHFFPLFLLSLDFLLHSLLAFIFPFHYFLFSFPY